MRWYKKNNQWINAAFLNVSRHFIKILIIFYIWKIVLFLVKKSLCPRYKISKMNTESQRIKNIQQQKTPKNIIPIILEYFWNLLKNKNISTKICFFSSILVVNEILKQFIRQFIFWLKMISVMIYKTWMSRQTCVLFYNTAELLKTVKPK